MTYDEKCIFKNMRTSILDQYGFDVKIRTKDYKSVALKMAYIHLIMKTCEGATLKEMASLIDRHHAMVIHYRDKTIPALKLSPGHILSIYFREWFEILLRMHPILKQKQRMTLPCTHYLNKM